MLLSNMGHLAILFIPLMSVDSNKFGWQSISFNNSKAGITIGWELRHLPEQVMLFLTTQWY